MLASLINLRHFSRARGTVGSSIHCSLTNNSRRAYSKCTAIVGRWIFVATSIKSTEHGYVKAHLDSRVETLLSGLGLAKWVLQNSNF